MTGKKLRRFFIEDIDESKGYVEIKGEEFRHLKNVLRLGLGAALSVFDGKGVEYAGKIESVVRGTALVKLLEKKEAASESSVDLTLLQAITKGIKIEWIVQKAVELGVGTIVLYFTSRTVPKIDIKLAKDKINKKIERLQKVAIEAAKQCGRPLVPEISFMNFQETLERTQGGLKIALYEEEKTRKVKDTLKQYTEGGVTILIGPEGGLSEREATRLRGEGFVLVGLGPRILRSETAALAALTIIQYELGDMG